MPPTIPKAAFSTVILAGRYSTDYDELRIGPSFASVAPVQSVVTPPVATLSSTPDLSEEIWGPSLLTVTLDKPAPASLTINLIRSGAGDTDWFSVPDWNRTSLTIATGATSGSVQIWAHQDDIAEGDETLTYSLVSGTGYAPGTPATSTLVIADSALGAWRASKFGAAANDPATAGEEADPDADSFANRWERYLGQDPLTPDNASRFQLNPVDEATARFRFPWAGDGPGLAWRVEVSNDLQTWSSVTPSSVTTLPEGGGEWLEAVVPINGP